MTTVVANYLRQFLDLPEVDWRDVASGEVTFDAYGTSLDHRETVWEMAEAWSRAGQCQVTAFAAWLHCHGEPRRVALVILDEEFWSEVRQRVAARSYHGNTAEIEAWLFGHACWCGTGDDDPEPER